MISNFLLGTKKIGKGFPCFVIAEVGQAHDGSLGLAHSFIDAAADAGVDAIKFQTHIADAESTINEDWRVAFSYEDKSRYDYWKRVSFSAEEWSELSQHASARGLVFLSTPFSIEAFDLLSEINIVAWKVASGEILSDFLINRFIASRKPLLISSGMSRWEELSALATRLQLNNVPYCFLQCTSKYPPAISEVGLNVMHEMRTKLGPIVGLSDHSGNLDIIRIAIANGANVVEAHITFDRRMFGPDSRSSLVVDEFKEIVKFRDTAHLVETNPIDKDKMADELHPLRQLFMRSIALKKDAIAGTILTEDLLTFKKPASGIPSQSMHTILGKSLLRDVPSSRLLMMEDINFG